MARDPGGRTWSLHPALFQDRFPDGDDPRLSRVVKDNTDCVPHAGADAAHAVTKVHAVISLRALHWPVMDCEGHSITLPQRYDVSAALHARPLFGQDELATSEVLAGLGEKNCDLDRECEIAIRSRWRQLKPQHIAAEAVLGASDLRRGIA